MRIGIDLGGTKIEAIAIAADGRELLRRRIDAPRGDYDRTLAAIAGIVDDVERETGERGTVGVGMPALDRAHLLRPRGDPDREGEARGFERRAARRGCGKRAVEIVYKRY